MGYGEGMIAKPIQCVIVLPPEGQRRARSRAFLRTTAAGKQVAISTTHKATAQRTAEEKLLSLLYEYRPPAPEPGPVLVGVRAYLPIPKSFSKKKRALALAGELRPTVKPDLDNLLKHLKDVCKGVFWQDDKQVIGYLPGTGKYYGEPARWEITVTTLALASRTDLGEEEKRYEKESQSQSHRQQPTRCHQESSAHQPPKEEETLFLFNPGSPGPY